MFKLAKPTEWDSADGPVWRISYGPSAPLPNAKVQVRGLRLARPGQSIEHNGHYVNFLVLARGVRTVGIPAYILETLRVEGGVN